MCIVTAFRASCVMIRGLIIMTLGRGVGVVVWIPFRRGERRTGASSSSSSFSFTSSMIISSCFRFLAPSGVACAPSEVDGTPSEVGIAVGMIPGVLFRVCRLCVHGACQISLGLVGLWDDGGSSGTSFLIFVVASLNIVANFSNASLCRSGYFVRPPWSLLTARTSRSASLVASSIGDSVGKLLCSG